MTNEVINKILKFPVIPVFYDDSPENSIQVMDSCYQGGIRVFEYVNRGPQAESNFEKLLDHKNKFLPDMSLGIGTILNGTQAARFVELGCEFLVSPLYDDAIATVAKEQDTFWIPGCMTPSEIGKASRSGFTFIKIFPGGMLGPSFVKAVLPLFPDISIMPTGGVACTQQSLEQWFSAGVKAVGLGSQLFKKENDGYKYEQIENDCRDLLRWASTKSPE